MKNRINVIYYYCSHFDIKPIWYINSNTYIFYCEECNSFILKEL